MNGKLFIGKIHVQNRNIMAADDGLLTYLTSAAQRVISQTSAESYRKGVV